jgi:hypothetical protein
LSGRKVINYNFSSIITCEDLSLNVTGGGVKKGSLTHIWMLPNILSLRREIMSPRSKREYLETVYLRYKQATRSEKSSILDEFCVTHQCHRKHAIRIFRGFKRFTKPKARKRGKPSVYLNEAVLVPLKAIWLAANLPCSKRLKAMLPL